MHRGRLWLLSASSVAVLGSLAAAAHCYSSRHPVVSRAPVAPQPTTVRVSEHALFLNEQKLCALPPLAEQATAGVGVPCKHAGAASDRLFYIDALGRALPHPADERA